MTIPAREIVEKAEHLAARLNGEPTPVTKNVLLVLVSDFMNEREPDVRRLRQLLEMIEQGSGGHIRRGAGYGDQLRSAVREIRRVLDEGGLEGGDLKSLFGWTARLLLVRRAPRETHSTRPPDEGRRPGRPETGRPAPGRPEPRPARPTAPKFGSVDPKGLSALEKMKRDLEAKEKNGKS